MAAVEIKPILIKRWLRLFIFRVIVLGAHYIAVMDALTSLKEYPSLKEVSQKTSNLNTTGSKIAVTESIEISKPAVIGYCDMTTKLSEKDLESKMLNFNMSFFLLLGFYGIAAVNFLVKTVVSLRLAMFSIDQQMDAIGRPLPTKWHKVQDMTFNLASFPCDMGIMSCIVGLYAVKRGKEGLGCWQCFNDPKCLKEEDLDKILFMSSLALNLNFILVLAIVFYKGFISYFRQTDPEKCDCHCEAPRCVTGCFVSLVITCVIMMPPFLVMDLKVLGNADLKVSGFTSGMMQKMMLVGAIIWGVAGIAIFVVAPIKLILMRDKNPKKK